MTNQPRVPAGSPNGGQWTSATAGKGSAPAVVLRSITMRPGEEIHAAKTKLAAAAQKVYDAWDQNEEGIDEELGAGGICQDIAEEMAGVLNEQGLDATSVAAEIGEQHVWVVARAKDGVFLVDIPPGVYETGGGYNWKKRAGVVFTEDDLIIDRLSPNPKDFGKFTDGDVDDE